MIKIDQRNQRLLEVENCYDRRFGFRRDRDTIILNNNNVHLRYEPVYSVLDVLDET